MNTQNNTCSDTARPQNQGRIPQIFQRIFVPVDNASLVYFRIVFGAFMIYHVRGWCISGRIDERLINPVLHFTYYGFDWIRPWPGDLMYLHFYVMAGLATTITIGLFYRVSAVLFCLAYWYAWLIDKTEYINHYYLCGLIAFLMIFLPAHRSFSLDALIRPERRSGMMPTWALWLLRVQLGIPYFFGGIAKLNYDWLHGQPARLWMARKSGIPIIGDVVTEEWFVGLVAYGGLLFDLLIVPALLWRRTRLLGYGVSLLFHLSNSQLFSIGIFPWFMIASTLLFFDPDWPRRILRCPLLTDHAPANGKQLSKQQLLVVMCLGLYLSIQVLVPLRHFVIRDNIPSWSEVGHNFSWHMMLRSKRGAARFYVTDPQLGHSGVFDVRQFLTPR
ncbi:MAG: HTTM domain-containing protein, partial [Planctomycetota bacterium]|nr:HTTM domain-containing protein [Planctomycetota bacterium]